MQFIAGTKDHTLFCKGKAAVDDHLISVISWFHDVLFSDGDPKTSGGEDFTVEERHVSLHEALAIAKKGDTIARSNNTEGREGFKRATDEQVASFRYQHPDAATTLPAARHRCWTLPASLQTVVFKTYTLHTT